MLKLLPIILKIIWFLSFFKEKTNKTKPVLFQQAKFVFVFGHTQFAWTRDSEVTVKLHYVILQHKPVKN